jgi:hypothetical protein
MAVPYTFGTATAAIPLSQLDSNFATTITIGNTAVQLGNTVTTLNNMTLANVTISSGNVTITNIAVTTANVSGTANISTLVVVGNATVGGNTTITGNITAANANVTSDLVLFGGTANGVAYLNTSKQVTTGSALVFNGTDFGIGTAAPSGYLNGTAKLVVLGNANSQHTALIRNDNAGSSASAALALTASGNTWGIECGSSAKNSNALTFQLDYGGGNSTKMTLDASGNLGIGTSSPSVKLHASTSGAGIQEVEWLNNSQAVGADVGSAMVFTGTSSNNGLARISGAFAGATTADGAYMAFSTRAVTTGALTERMRIASTGIVTMSAYGVGTATFSAAGVISSVSDETWKIKDGVPVDPDAMLKKLEPGYWYYNDEKKEIFGTDRQLGFYAQNVNAAIGSEAAPTPEEGKPWGYYDRSVLAVTVMSLQKALATIETLTARITALEGA